MTAWEEACAVQSNWCRRLEAPFMALLCETLPRAVDERSKLGWRLVGWGYSAQRDALVLRLAGGLHHLVRSGAVPDLAGVYPPPAATNEAELLPPLQAALADHQETLLTWLESAPQTNEVGRSSLLMAGLMVALREYELPVALFEVGASAGLNLRLDDYAYDLGSREFGRPGSPVSLRPEWTGAPPPSAPLKIAARRGCDLAPLDVTDPKVRERLLSYCWSEQRERMQRLEAALELAAADPPLLDEADAAAWTERHIEPRAGTLTVLAHTIALQYFPAESQAAIASYMQRRGGAATAEAPLAWLGFELNPEAGRAELHLTLWPGGERRLLAAAHPHGTWIEWLA